MHPSIPMTPYVALLRITISNLTASTDSLTAARRSVATSGGIDFARQLAERNNTAPTTKKIRSSAAPKGTKLAAGYQDRTQLRTSAEEDDKAARIKALEEMVMLGQMERAVFEGLRDEIVGGDVRDSHLVKGLDWKLLERVKRGEDVLSVATGTTGTGEKAEKSDEPGDTDVEEQLDRLEEREIQPVVKEEREKKKGEMAPPPSLVGKKRNRDEILKELKASRLARVEEEKKAQQQSLGPRFRKLGEVQEKSRIEKDKKGREVLITVDEDGMVKRKVRKVKANEGVADNNSLLMPDKDLKPLGMEVPEIAAPVLPEADVDGDIFEGVGNDYDPLGGFEEDDSISNEEGQAEESPRQERSPSLASENGDGPPSPPEERSFMLPPPPPLPDEPPNTARNYFGVPTGVKEREATSPTATTTTTKPLTDPTILAALKKASTITPISSASVADGADAEEAATMARRKRMLESHDRDAEDMDLGFGSSRFGDQEDGEDNGKIQLSVWGKDDGDAKGDGKGKGGRKRGPKKRKGDKDSAADVLRVMERRKGEGK